MKLPLQNFSTLVEAMSASVQGASTTVLDVTVGSVLRAILEASASVALWLQYVALQVLAMTRLSSSNGADADSWVADFGLARLPAAAAAGTVTMSSFNPAAQASTIADGMTVRLSDGSQSFVVVGGPYVRPIGKADIEVAIRAERAGASGNVPAGAVNVLGAAIPGIDTVTNRAALSGGAAAETDAALRSRFVNYINTRAQATEQAFLYAASSVGQAVTIAIQENVTASGATLAGNVHVIVDDGTGAPSAGTLAAVATALDAVRPVGTTVSIAAPTVLAVSVTASLSVAIDADGSRIVAQAKASIEAHVNGLAVGQVLPFSRIIALLYGSSESIRNVTAVAVNGAGADVGGMPGSVVRCRSVALSVMPA